MMRCAALITILLFTASCSGGSNADAADPAPAGSSADSNGKAAGSAKHACEILTVEFVKESLGLSELTPDKPPKAPNPGGKAPTYSACSLEWKSGKMREMEVGGRTISYPDENSVTLSISIVEPGKDKAAYDTGVNHLKDRNEHQALSGVGEEAMWFPAMRQISARGNGNVIHLAVRYVDGEGDPLDYAKSMALKVFEELN